MSNLKSDLALVIIYPALLVVTTKVLQVVSQFIGLILSLLRGIQKTRSSEADANRVIDISPVTSDGDQAQEAPATTAFTRPPLRRRNCFLLGPNGRIADPFPSDAELDSPSTPDSEEYWTAPEYQPSTSDSEGYETAPIYPFPSYAMDKRTTLYGIEEHLSDFNDPAMGPYPTSCDEDAEALLQRRNIRMRDEGIRLNISYSQLASLTAPGGPTSAPWSPPQLQEQQQQPDATPYNTNTRASRVSSTSSSTCPSTEYSALFSPALAPAPSPAGGTTAQTTPDHPHHHLATAYPPATGRAAEALVTIEEKLLAIPADAVSRRLLRDGREALRNSRVRLAKGVSFADGSSSSGQVFSSLVVEEWYPSDMME